MFVKPGHSSQLLLKLLSLPEEELNEVNPITSHMHTCTCMHTLGRRGDERRREGGREGRGEKEGGSNVKRT